MPPSHRIATGNRLLDALPADELERLQPHFEPISCTLKQVLFRPGDSITAVYFPIRCVFSAVSPLQDGAVIEIATIGKEGLAGLPAFLDEAMSFREIVVQGAGPAIRVNADFLRSAFDRSDLFRNLILRYAELFLDEVTQTAACNAHHTLEARYARWLLTMSDQLETDRFPISQEFLAMLLGVRRTGVTATALSLRLRGIIQYGRGQVNITDRARLEGVTCECYAAIKALHGRLTHNK